MRSLLLSIIERAHARATRKKAKSIQWHSRKETNAEWRSIMAKYRSPLSEAPGPNIKSPEDERPHDPRVIGVGVPPAVAGGLAQRLAAVRVSSDLASADRAAGSGVSGLVSIWLPAPLNGMVSSANKGWGLREQGWRNDQ